MTAIRVVVADDQPVVRDALADLLDSAADIDVVGTASNAQEAIAQCAILTPDVVLMDVKMPGGGGVKATREIRRHHPETRVVAFSAHQDRATVMEMLDAGAVGYMTKGSPPADIVAAVRDAGQARPSRPPATPRPAQSGARQTVTNGRSPQHPTDQTE